MNSFIYLGDTVCEDGGSSKEIQRRVQAGAAAWRRVEGIMWDRKLKKQLSVGSLRGTSLRIWIGNTGTDRETGEDTDSRKQLGPKNIQSNPRRQKEDEGIERRD